MQCASCHFENMPGVKACGRCGASLQLAALAIGVHPPRASALAKRWRRWFGWMHGSLGRASERLLEAILGPNARRPTWRVIVRMAVPGWPHLYLGQALRGWFLLVTFLVMGIGALSSMGTTLGAVCLGLTVSIHAASVLDVVDSQTVKSRARHIYLIGCLAGVGLGIYLPLGCAASAWMVPHPMLMTVPPFVAGDVVLMSPATYWSRAPRPGDVVLYEIPWGEVRGEYERPSILHPADDGRIVHYQIEGRRVDRVLAAAGQHVRIKGGKLLVDGKESPYLPLNPKRMPGSLDLTVPEGNVFILPTTVLEEKADLSRLDWRHFSLVSVSKIAGRVYVRNWPWRRFTLF